MFWAPVFVVVLFTLLYLSSVATFVLQKMSHLPPE